MRSLPTRPARRTVVATAGAFVALSGILLAPATVAAAKEYDIAGTVECGARSGRHCPIGDTLTLRTDDLGGKGRLATINVSWIRRRLRSLDQDDPLDLEVRDRPDGTIQAIGVAGEGSFVNRLNFGVREEYNAMKGSIQAGVGRARNDDERMNEKGIRRQEDLRRHR